MATSAPKSHPSPFHRHLLPLGQNRRLRRRIGVMGGSFNPAHDGHYQISISARKSACLAEVWWLVSPQNPLKSEAGMASFSHRLCYARQRYSSCWLRIADFEEKMQLQRTYDTLNALKRALPLCDFIWIMGADNLIQLPQWHQAARIAAAFSILVMNRPGYGYRALAGKGGFMLSARWRKSHPRALNRRQRGWSFVPAPNHAISATQIRQQTS